MYFLATFNSLSAHYFPSQFATETGEEQYQSAIVHYKSHYYAYYWNILKSYVCSLLLGNQVSHERGKVFADAAIMTKDWIIADIWRSERS